MLKKILSAMLIIVIMASFITIPALASIFPDVTETNYSWAVKPIEEMVKLSIIKGYTDGTFKPEKSVTKMEALVLVARILGFTNEDNKEFVQFASEFYADGLAAYDIKYKNEVAFLLYKNVLQESELYYYIGGENANLGLKRYEAAMLLTKAMGAEEEAKKAINTASPYTDSADIPATAKQYVNFVTEISLMNGMNKTATKNDFVPMFEVNRAQIAVLLYRMMDILNEKITIGKIDSVDSGNNTIMYTDLKGNQTGFTILFDDKPIIKQDGYSVALGKLTAGSKIALVERDNEIYAIETLTVKGDEVFEGVVSSIYASNTASKITVYKLGETKTFEYPISSDVAITYEGGKGSITDIKKTDYVVMQIKKDTVVSINATKKDRTIRGTVNAIIVDPDFVFEILLSSGITEKYTIADEAKAKRNGTDVSVSSILVGDKVNITLAYEQIAVISATSTNFTATGIIDSITIATMPSIKIKGSDSKVTEYSVSRNTVYIIDGKEATIYDLRLNANVTVNVESETVVKITSTAPTTSAAMTGVIESINKSYGFFTMSVTDPLTGQISTVQVFMKKTNLKVINSADGKEKTTNNLDVGMKISVTGAINTGAFEATTIIILP